MTPNKTARIEDHRGEDVRQPLPCHPFDDRAQELVVGIGIVSPRSTTGDLLGREVRGQFVANDAQHLLERHGRVLTSEQARLCAGRATPPFFVVVRQP